MEEFEKDELQKEFNKFLKSIIHDPRVGKEQN